MKISGKTEIIYEESDIICVKSGNKYEVVAYPNGDILQIYPTEDAAKKALQTIRDEYQNDNYKRYLMMPAAAVTERDSIKKGELTEYEQRFEKEIVPLIESGGFKVLDYYIPPLETLQKRRCKHKLRFVIDWGDIIHFPDLPNPDKPEQRPKTFAKMRKILFIRA